jgi:hypothetical protein
MFLVHFSDRVLHWRHGKAACSMGPVQQIVMALLLMMLHNEVLRIPLLLLVREAGNFAAHDELLLMAVDADPAVDAATGMACVPSAVVRSGGLNELLLLLLLLMLPQVPRCPLVHVHTVQTYIVHT